MPWGSAGVHSVLQALLSLLIHGLTQPWGGCKVPTCFMVMHSTVGEGGFSIGSSARCARPSLAVTQAPTSAGHPTAGGICSDPTYPKPPTARHQGSGCTWAVHSIDASPWSCPQLSWPPVGTPERSMSQPHWDIWAKGEASKLGEKWGAIQEDLGCSIASKGFPARFCFHSFFTFL